MFHGADLGGGIGVGELADRETEPKDENDCDQSTGTQPKVQNACHQVLDAGHSQLESVGVRMLGKKVPPSFDESRSSGIKPAALSASPLGCVCPLRA